MNNFLTTSEERDQFLQWLERRKDGACNSRNEIFETVCPKDWWFEQGRYEALLEVIAYVKTGGKL